MVKQPTRKAQNFRIADFLAAFREMHKDANVQIQAIRNIANQGGGDTVELPKKKLWALIGALDRLDAGAAILNEALGGLPDDPEAEDIIAAVTRDVVPLRAYQVVRELLEVYYRRAIRSEKNAKELADALCHNSDQETEMLKFFIDQKTKPNNGRQ
jgi:hypothetical protein